jgi:hypothetical protein
VGHGVAASRDPRALPRRLPEFVAIEWPTDIAQDPLRAVRDLVRVDLGFVKDGTHFDPDLADLSAAHALVATLLYPLVAFWLPIPIGGVAYLAFPRRYP